MQLSQKAFKTAIRKLYAPGWLGLSTVEDRTYLASCSYLDHHVEGLTYLCLHRDEKTTVKVYLIDSKVANKQGYLVHPHNHRYDFASIVLKGNVGHIRFKRALGHPTWKEYAFNFTDKSLRILCERNLEVQHQELYGPGQRYYVTTNEIHTLKVNYVFNEGQPVIIGLIQEEDTNDDSRLYIPNPDLLNFQAKSKVMTLTEYDETLKTLYQLLECDHD